MTGVFCKCDLRHLFGPIRDQGSRPTCLAFAASDAHAALRPGWVPLSCEYLYYHAQRRGGRTPQGGATLPDTLAALEHEGQPQEAGWPYTLQLPSTAVNWCPPSTVGELFRRVGHPLSDTLEEIVAELTIDRPVLVLMTLSDSFFAANLDGVVDAKPHEQPEKSIRHAVVAVGYGEALGQRVILIRNSWGEGWGDHGYAWLTERYLGPRVMKLAKLAGEINVPTSANAA